MPLIKHPLFYFLGIIFREANERAMVKIPARFFLFFLVTAFFSLYASPAHSKTRTQSLFPFKSIRAVVTKDQLNQFERQLTDYFSTKANKTNAPAVSVAVQRPSQADYFMISKYWNFFSLAFKALYLKSQEIDPAMDQSYVSPGGHFEIYYTMRGTYAVATDDAYGYSASDWREKSLSPNGVPDYIDEVAWALDSAWSMEVDGFGFVKPLVYTDATHKSSRYKVEVDLADDADYGLTDPVPINTPGAGSASILQIRNNWAGFSTSSIDYSRHPELAVRVTCVHEFFHAIQYAMTRQATVTPTNYLLDDFPLSWLEGTAALMENIGFDSVNDYLQYVGYFSENPYSTILNNNDPYEYTTVLLAMFLYERILNAPTIGFVKEMFFNNYAKPIGFLANLDSTAKSFNSTWPELLVRFYTESYFTGERSRPGYFVHDAPLFDSWPLDADSLDIAYSIRKNVPAYGMETFSITKKNYPYDNLSMDFFGDTLASGAPAFWSMHCLVKKPDGTQDSIFSVPISSRSQASATISAWPAFDTAIFFVANAQGNFDRNAALVFQPCPISLHKGDSATFVCAISQPISAESAARVSVKALSDLACSLSIQSVSATSTQRGRAGNERLVPVNVYYEIAFPLSWNINAAMTLYTQENASACLPLENIYGMGAGAFAIFRWDETASAWTKSGAISDTGSIYSWRGSITNPGTYGLFGAMPVPLDSLRADSVVVFPNPVHVRGGAAVTMNGVRLLELLVYTITGTLVYATKNASPVTHMQWQLVNARGKTIAPGAYYAVIGYEDPVTKGMKKLKRKVIVVP
jgi:hypothetical protein